MALAIVIVLAGFAIWNAVLLFYKFRSSKKCVNNYNVLISSTGTDWIIPSVQNIKNEFQIINS